MNVSCGLLLTDGKSLLLCHVTNKPQWDIPKGMMEAGETPLDCMFRELREETGLVFDREEEENILDLGIYDYLSTKKLHLFLYETKTEEFPDTHQMACNSMFTAYDKEYPELDAFKYVPIDELERYTSPRLFPVISKALEDFYRN